MIASARVVFLIFAMLLPLSLLAGCERGTPPARKLAPLRENISHGDIVAAFDPLLSTYVHDGEVDYAGLKKNNAALASLVRDFASLTKADFDGYPEAEQIAFLVNAYNALTLKVIVDHYPIESRVLTSLAFPKNSIRQISGAWDSIEHELLGGRMTLNHIEHEILRKEYQEPGIHMALVCAAVSCPKLRSESYVGDRLSEQLEDQARDFLGTPSKFRLLRDEDTVYLSSIFDWFGDDFTPVYEDEEFFRNLASSSYSTKEKSVLTYVAAHLEEADAAFIRTQRPAVKYLDYDWSLNEKSSQRKHRE